MNAVGSVEPAAPPLDAQYAELVELVWDCEIQWNVDNQVDACIKYETR